MKPGLNIYYFPLTEGNMLYPNNPDPRRSNDLAKRRINVIILNKALIKVNNIRILQKLN